MAKFETGEVIAIVTIVGLVFIAIFFAIPLLQKEFATSPTPTPTPQIVYVTPEPTIVPPTPTPQIVYVTSPPTPVPRAEFRLYNPTADWDNDIGIFSSHYNVVTHVVVTNSGNKADYVVAQCTLKMNNGAVYTKTTTAYVNAGATSMLTIRFNEVGNYAFSYDWIQLQNLT